MAFCQCHRWFLWRINAEKRYCAQNVEFCDNVIFTLSVILSTKTVKCCFMPYTQPPEHRQQQCSRPLQTQCVVSEQTMSNASLAVSQMRTTLLYSIAKFISGSNFSEDCRMDLHTLSLWRCQRVATLYCRAWKINSNADTRLCGVISVALAVDYVQHHKVVTSQHFDVVAEVVYEIKRIILTQVSK